MQKRNVKIGETYWATVSGKRVKVRIDNTSPYGGWDATNTVTGRKIRIRTAGRLKMTTVGFLAGRHKKKENTE